MFEIEIHNNNKNPKIKKKELGQYFNFFFL